MENNIQSVNAENVEVKEEQAAQKTYSEKEVMELLQRESDRRVSQALKKQSEKYEKQLSLSKLDGDEREKAEKDNRIAELEEKLVEFQTEKNKSELKSVLSARGLSAEFADIINISSDIEASQANIDKLDKLFQTTLVIPANRTVPIRKNRYLLHVVCWQITASLSFLIFITRRIGFIFILFGKYPMQITNFTD